MLTRLLQVMIPLLGVTAMLLGVTGVGRATHEWLRLQDLATVPFHHIECDGPCGLSREEFLDEVQYLGSFPDRLRLLDKDLAERLAAAFARHPKVERVVSVEIASPTRVQVHLIFRTSAGLAASGGR